MKLAYTSVFSYLRVAFAGTLLSAALAMAFVAVNNPGVSSASRPHRLLKKQAEYGLASRSEMSDKTGTGEDPTKAAAEDYANRAYPADDIPFSATLNAIAGFKQLKGKATGKDPLGVWQLIGPSTANFPDILTFSGASYTTSGRITALAIDPNCSNVTCRVWVGAAGGGVWRTTNALAGGPSWTFISGSFGTNAIGSLLLDPNDPTHNTIYAGTGEPNASGDSEAGVGVYKSTDGGNTWALVPDSGKFFQRSIGQMAIDNAGNLLVPIASGIRGVSSVTGGASSSGATGHPLISRGLYRCNGLSCTQIFTAPTSGCGTRGSTTVRVDPTHTGTGGTSIIYVNAFGGSFLGAGNGGIWRSIDNGVSFQQIFAPRDASLNTCASALERDEFDVTTLGSGATRMYVGAGEGGEAFNPASPQSTFWRSDNADTAATFASFGGAQVVDYCTGQCWYDNYVVTTAGNPDIVYLGGSFSYGQLVTIGNGTSNARGVLLSQNAGVTWTDQTRDATTAPPPAGSCCNNTAVAGNSIHPDQHALVVNPSNPIQFFEGSDGGLVRSTGTLSDISSQCAARGLTGADLTFCQGLLSAVPSHLFSLNKQLSTLQFQSLSVSAQNPLGLLQGGTQDNGTFQYNGSNVVWPQIIYGDGGQSGFSVTNSSMRFNSFFGQFHDANFQNGDPSKWVIISGRIAASVEPSAFYVPLIADPNSGMPGTIFEGSRHVWRTQDWGGSQAYLEANCPEFTTSGANTACGDFEPLGGASAAICDTPPFTGCLNSGGDLGGTFYGTDRRPTSASRVGSAIARTPINTNTAWAATGGGRVFISDNVDNATPASVVWNRVDPDLATTADPTRFPSTIYIDPTNVHHAWISYSGYNVNTPTQPGHVFDVSWSGAGAATWTNISYNLPDFPITAVVSDDNTGDLYAASDFGVMRLPFGTTTWVVTSGLPMVEVAGLTIVPSSRVLYAATHGRSAWKVTLP